MGQFRSQTRLYVERSPRCSCKSAHSTTSYSKRLSSFTLEDRIGVGLKIGEGQRVGIRAIHYSNADIKQPNEGIESYALFYSHQI
ncbi:acyloxyacyl hydrolase [Pseudomonas sp. KU43P]|uniref:acyloxyacyl hydrolase n=1 Tax=Pseudomonas sp. KU43P TaxID=2487887 RepID=UPI003987C938